ncbi:MAG: hypothetical protein WBV94_21730 [Blastocatellia bacterium]
MTKGVYINARLYIEADREPEQNLAREAEVCVREMLGSGVHACLDLQVQVIAVNEISKEEAGR